MAEFLSQEEIDAFLDIAEQGDEIQEKTNLDEMIDILNYIKNKRLTKIESLLLLTRVKHFLNKEFKEYNISETDAELFHSKASNAILVQEILEKSQEDKFFIKNKTEDIKLCYTLSKLSTEEGIQQSLDTLNDIESIVI